MLVGQIILYSQVKGEVHLACGFRGFNAWLVGSKTNNIIIEGHSLTKLLSSWGWGQLQKRTRTREGVVKEEIRPQGHTSTISPDATKSLLY